jgi:uncharacterized protein (TIGR02145 family)
LADEYVKLAVKVNNSRTKEYLIKADTFYSKTKNNKEGYAKIADSYFNRKSYKNAVSYYEKAYSDNTKKLKESYNKTADVYIKFSEKYERCSSEAEERYDKAVEYYLKAENCEAIEKIGDIFFKAHHSFCPNKFERANKYYQTAFTVNEEHMRGKYNSIADDFAAKKHFQISCEYYKKAGNFNRIKEIADYCFNTYKYKRKSILCYEILYENETTKLTELYIKFADDCLKDRNYEDAAEYYGKAYAGNTLKLNESYKKIADILFAKKEYEKAAEYYGKAGLKREEEKSKSYYSFTDKRDGKTYGKVYTGNNVWMTENLAYQTSKGCWESGSSSKYGYLYSWETAKNVCPEGWHLPTKEDFEQLIKYNGCNIYGFSSCAYNSLTGSFSIGFLLGGERTNEGDYKNFKSVGMYWSSTDQYQYDDVTTIYCLQVGKEFGYEGGTNYGGTRKAGIVGIYDSNRGFSVRCVRD